MEDGLASPAGSPEADENPFNVRIWGPEGWTEPMRAMLEPYLCGYTSGGLESFAAVPQHIAISIANTSSAAGVDVGYLGAADVVALVQLAGDTVTFAGYAVEPERGDERITFTMARLDITGMDIAERDALCEHLWAHDYGTEAVTGDGDNALLIC